MNERTIASPRLASPRKLSLWNRVSNWEFAKRGRAEETKRKEGKKKHGEGQRERGNAFLHSSFFPIERGVQHTWYNNS